MLFVVEDSGLEAEVAVVHELAADARVAVQKPVE
jgi:hypothetical protein